jgi:hypothetical protein
MPISLWWDREPERGEWEPEPYELPLVEPAIPRPSAPSGREEPDVERGAHVVVIELV